MKLWKNIDLKDFGTSRQIRFGHLTGTKDWYIVLAQAQKRINRDAYPNVNCLTAIDLDGNILWQRGEPSKKTKVIGKVSADLPLQVYDIDGDGIDEVITAFNFEIQILDGRTGEIKKMSRHHSLMMKMTQLLAYHTKCMHLIELIQMVLG